MEKVTIGITTYNLDKYVAQALDSVLSQQTNFDYSILVVDDASTDGTRAILREYEQRFPDKVRVIFLEKNGGSLHASNTLFNGIKTQYFAFLDGDDFWLTTDRLQRQVDFLDAHPDYVMCGGNTQYMRDSVLSDLVISQESVNNSYDFGDYKLGHTPFVHTSSIVLRNVIYKDGIPQDYVENEHTIFNCAYRGEDIRFVSHLKCGKLFVMPDILSVYRIHPKGIWQGKSMFNRKLESAISLLKFNELFGDDQFCIQRYKDEFGGLYVSITEWLGLGYPQNKTEQSLVLGLLTEMSNPKYDWSFLTKPKFAMHHNGLYRPFFMLWRALGKLLRKAQPALP